jgi:nucleotide-binding universal stress UspA family protein
MNDPIIVGTDGSPTAGRAVEWAAAEASRRRSPLHIVYAAHTRESVPAYSSAFWEVDLLGEAGRHILVQAAELAAKTAPDVVVTTELVFEAPAFALRERSERAAELVVGHRGRGGFAALLLGSTGLSLAGHTSCPLVVVRGGAYDQRNEVLVGVDSRDDEGSPALEYAFDAAARQDAWVRAVHAWEVPPEPFERNYPETVRQALAEEQERLSATMAPWRRRYPGVRVVEETPKGQPIAELTARSTGACLLVVGSHHDGGPHLGSVGHGAIHHADCPVAVVGR